MVNLIKGIYRLPRYINQMKGMYYLPSERKSGEGLHDFVAEVSLLGVILQGHVQGMTEDVLHLVSMHDSHPLTPQ